MVLFDLFFISGGLFTQPLDLLDAFSSHRKWVSQADLLHCER